MTTGLVGAGLGTIRGLGESVMSGQFGTQQGADLVEQRAQQGMESLTYSPGTQSGQQYAAEVGVLQPLASVAPVFPGASGAATGSIGAAYTGGRSRCKSWRAAVRGKRASALDQLAGARPRT